MATELAFGFLNLPWHIDFGSGHISPVQRFEEISKELLDWTHQDEFLYPPLSRRRVLDPKTYLPIEEVPRTERPALLYRLPPSHTLSFVDPTITDLDREASAFIIHLLGYLFGVRLQFSDWYFDGRVPMRVYLTHNTHLSQSTAAHFVSHSFRTWRGWTDEERRLTSNVLFMHTRASSYEWGWERFTIEYMVLDACWRLAQSRYSLQSVPHAERIQALCQRFGIQIDAGLIGRIVELRNRLFHETLWDGSQPCTAVGADAFMQPYNLRRLNQRLIPALLGYTNRYVHTPWWIIDPFLFDRT